MRIYYVRVSRAALPQLSCHSDTGTSTRPTPIQLYIADAGFGGPLATFVTRLLAGPCSYTNRRLRYVDQASSALRGGGLVRHVLGATTTTKHQ